MNKYTDKDEFLAFFEKMINLANENGLKLTQMPTAMEMLFNQRDYNQDEINKLFSLINPSELSYEGRYIVDHWGSDINKHNEEEDYPFKDVVSDDQNVLVKPVLFYKNQICYMTRNDESFSGHKFGGRDPDIIISHNAHIPHLLFRLDTQYLLSEKELPFSKIPIFFPFNYNSELNYKISNDQSIQIEAPITKTISSNYPYENYPKSFPEINFTNSKYINCDKEMFQNYFWQLIDFNEKEEIVFVVPESREYGVSLWTNDNSRAFVSCVFTINIVTGKIHAFTDCS